MRHIHLLVVVAFASFFVLSLWQEERTARPAKSGGAAAAKPHRRAEKTTTLSFSSTETLRDLSELECKPLFFGYTWEEGEALFPPAAYPQCRERFASIPRSDFDVDKQVFELQCEGNATGKFVLGPRDQSFLLLKEAKRGLSSQQYAGPQAFSSVQDFVFATCNETSRDFEVVHYTPRYSALLHHRLRKAAKSRPGLRSKPLAIVLLTLDSFSRRHFYQKLPETVALLNSVKAGSEFAVFDFLLHNVQGANSVQNMMPVFSEGGPAMWEEFAQAGFMTLLGFEDCDPGFEKHVTDPHYLMRAFFCAAFLYSPYNSHKKNTLKQRCIGPKMSHEYALDYLAQFSHMYKDVNQWMSVHLNTAHEASGRHAQLLDPDLSRFLRDFLRERGKTHEVFIVLHGDHGMRYGDWKSTAKAHQEHILPAFFLLASESLLKSVEGSHAHLQHNTQALTTKRDIRATLLQLLDFPTTRQLRPAKGDFYSLLSQSVPLKRTCEQARIPEWLCACTAREDLDPSEQMFAFFASEALSFANSEVYSRTDLSLGHICQALVLHAVVSAAHTALSAHEDFYSVEFAAQTPARFSADFYMREAEGRNDPSNFLATFLFARARKRFTVKLVSLERLDAFAGACEHISRSVELEPKWCLCGDLHTLRLRQPALFDEAQDFE